MNGDSILGEIVNLRAPQPAADVGSLCAIVINVSPFLPLNWAKIPCDYPIFRSGLMCKKPAVKTSGDGGAEGTGVLSLAEPGSSPRGSRSQRLETSD